MKKGQKLDIGRGNAQMISSPKPATNGKKPKKQTGNDLRSGK